MKTARAQKPIIQNSAFIIINSLIVVNLKTLIPQSTNFLIKNNRSVHKVYRRVTQRSFKKKKKLRTLRLRG